MKSRLRKLLIIPLLIISNHLLAQQGDYLITNHRPSINNIDNTNFQILQDSKGLMYFANRSGVLVYDGVEWDFYSTPGSALALAFGQKGQLFVGCLNDFGYIGYTHNTQEYISLSARYGKDIGMIYQIVNIGDRVIFVSEKKLYIFNESDNKFDTHTIGNDLDYYNFLFELDSSLYVNTSDGAVSKLDRNFEPDSTYFLPDSSNLAFIRQNPETGTVIAGTYAGNVYDISPGQIISMPCSEYFTSRNIQLVDGYWYDKRKFVIGTLEKGCLILDTRGKSVNMDTVDFDNGLPDNEISTLYVDNSHGIWVAHEFGLSRITPEIPIRSFSHYPGLEGNLFALQSFHNKMYVATSVGSYYLDVIRNYRKTVYYVRKGSGGASDQSVDRTNAGRSSGGEKAGAGEEDKRRGFLGLFRVRKKANEEETAPSQKTEETSRKNEQSRPGFFQRLFGRNKDETDKIKGISRSRDYVRKVRSKLQSVEYLYKPVEGVKAKCKQLIPFHDRLLAVSNSGIYDLTDGDGTLVIDEPARYVLKDTIHDQIIICGYDRTVKTYKMVGDLWVELQDISFSEIITTAGMDRQNNLWLASPGHVYKVVLNDSVFAIDQVYAIQNQLIDIPLMTNIRDKFYFIYSRGYFYYDGDSIREDPAYREAIGLPVRYIQSPDGLVWIYNGKTWNRIDSDGKVEPFEYLSLFPEMRFISYNSDRDTYGILTSDNKIYIYEHYLGRKMQPGSDLILRRISTNNGLITDHNKINLTWEDNALSFKFSEPDYLGLLKVEYQYKLLDHMKVWSEWSSINSVNLNYLQPGRYSLIVRARDTFGRIKETNLIAFRIKPPYWKQPWFYAMEILVLGSLILLVKRLRRVTIKYPFIVDGLGILTLVIILALIQSTIQTYFNIRSTPVADFIVNVVVALIAFPLEEKLRKLLI